MDRPRGCPARCANARRPRRGPPRESSRSRSRARLPKQTLNDSQMVASSETIGTNGTSGTRKPRSRSGCDSRSRMTPTAQNANAKSAPSTRRSARPTVPGSSASTAATPPANSAARDGAEPDPTWASPLGSRPSRPIANRTRLWAISTTSTTVVRPNSAPTLMTLALQPGEPAARSASETGAAVLSSP